MDLWTHGPIHSWTYGLMDLLTHLLKTCHRPRNLRRGQRGHFAKFSLLVGSKIMKSFLLSHFFSKHPLCPLCPRRHPESSALRPLPAPSPGSRSGSPRRRGRRRSGACPTTTNSFELLRRGSPSGPPFFARPFPRLPSSSRMRAETGIEAAPEDA